MFTTDFLDNLLRHYQHCLKMFVIKCDNDI